MVKVLMDIYHILWPVISNWSESKIKFAIEVSTTLVLRHFILRSLRSVVLGPVGKQQCFGVSRKGFVLIQGKPGRRRRRDEEQLSFPMESRKVCEVLGKVFQSG